MATVASVSSSVVVRTCMTRSAVIALPGVAIPTTTRSSVVVPVPRVSADHAWPLQCSPLSMETVASSSSSEVSLLPVDAAMDTVDVLGCQDTSLGLVAW